MNSNASEPAYRPEEVMFLDARGAVQEVRSAGLTKREAFAMAVDVSVYAPAITYQGGQGAPPTVDELAAYIAQIRCIEADALLAELAKDQP